MMSRIIIKKSHLYKLEIPAIISFFMFFCIVQIAYFDTPVYTLLKYIIVAITLVYVFKNVRILITTGMKIMIPVAGIGIGIIVSTNLNFDATYNIRGAIYYAALIITMFAFLHILGVKGKLYNFYRAGIMYLTVVLIINDLLMVINPERFYGVYGTMIGTFILGNKFNVAYAHLLLAILNGLKKKENQVKRYNICLIVAALIALYVQCKTVFLACVLLIILTIVPQTIKNALAKPTVFAVAFIASALIIGILTVIISWKPITYLIVEVLHKDLTLTGRLNIYRYLLGIISVKKWFGYGYMNTTMLDKTIWYANAQNGLWDFILNYGLVTAVFLFIMCLVVFVNANRDYKKVPEKINVAILIAVVYSYLFMGIVEICFSIQFFLYFALLNGNLANDTRKEQKKED